VAADSSSELPLNTIAYVKFNFYNNGGR